MKASETIAAAIGARLHAILRKGGFRKKGLVFRRTTDACETLVQAELSRGNAGAKGRFVLELGMYLPRVEQILGRSPVEAPSTWACTLRGRIGPATGETDPWFPVDEGTDPARLGAEVAERWLEAGAPLADKAGDFRALLHELREQRLWGREALVPAALAIAAGDPAMAAALLGTAISGIHEARVHRAIEGDTFGVAVLEDARRFAAAHGLG